MEQIILSLIKTTANNFDFTFCCVANILIYLLIKFYDEMNGNLKVPVLHKRLITLAIILILGYVYYQEGSNLKTIINSAILAPVFWSWILKPICSRFKIDYATKTKDDEASDSD